MAAFLWHGAFKTGRLVSTKNVIPRTYATKAEKRRGVDRKVGPRIDSAAESLAAKGFLRQQKEYSPPSDVQQQLQAIFNDIIGTTSGETKLTNLTQRFKLFQACEDKTGHEIPNSLLHSIQTLADVVKYYKTPVDVRTPFDKMKNMELPENLHIQHEYHRFHPDTDTKFGGVTAFPGRSTIVSGLKYKKKYAGHVQPPVEEKI